MAPPTAESFLNGAHRAMRAIGTCQYNPGTTARVKLSPLGVTTSLLLDCTIPVNFALTGTAGGAGLAGVSPQAPYNVVERVILTAPDGMALINAPLAHVACFNALRAGEYRAPAVPIGVIGETAVISFRVEIPFALSERDLRGAVDSNAGDYYLDLRFVPHAYIQGDDDYCYTVNPPAAGVASATTITVYQRYIVSNNPPPPITIRHTIADCYRMTALGGGVITVDYPPTKSCYGVLIVAADRGVMRDGNVARVTQLGGPLRVRDETPATLRDTITVDLPAGHFFLAHDSPVDSRRTKGNQVEIALGFSPQSGTDNNFVDVSFACLI